MNKTLIAELLQKDDPIIFEIGCADGGDTLDFFNLFKNPKMYCFEPEPKNIKILKERFKDNSNFNLFEGVVSDKDGEVLFYRSRNEGAPDALCYSGSIKSPKEHLIEWPYIKFDNNMSAISTTLDFFCEMNGIEKIDFIWMDVQGAEDNVFLGAKKMLQQSIRYIYTEYSNREYYVNQKNLTQLLEVVGSNWKIVKDFGTDVLIENINFK